MISVYEYEFATEADALRPYCVLAWARMSLGYHGVLRIQLATGAPFRHTVARPGRVIASLRQLRQIQKPKALSRARTES
jgi:hypothetical protein